LKRIHYLDFFIFVGATNVISLNQRIERDCQKIKTSLNSWCGSNTESLFLANTRVL